jgi:hypothetical protein
MTKQKIGLVLFWVAIVWTFFWGIAASICQTEFFLNKMTYDEFSQSVWSGSPLAMIWGFAPVLGAMVAGIAILLYSGAKGSTLLKFGFGIIVGFVLSWIVGSLGHISILFAIGGTCILLFFFGILWFWAKERLNLKGVLATAADFKLAGYVFMLMGMWFTCGIIAAQWVKALANRPPFMEPIIVMIFFVLGWLFIFLGYYKSRKRDINEK